MVALTADEVEPCRANTSDNIGRLDEQRYLFLRRTEVDRFIAYEQQIGAYCLTQIHQRG
jgi:hypothetical protein